MNRIAGSGYPVLLGEVIGWLYPTLNQPSSQADNLEDVMGEMMDMQTRSQGFLELGCSA